jgi:glyoxylase-like metal-dependent hydrolase (beta-lactamase superfamily II)
MPETIAWPTLVGRGEILAEPLGPGLLRLSESALCPEERSFFYLVEGDRRRCLIDGGWGIGADPAAVLGTSRAGPGLLAVATHSHYDHIGHLHRVVERLGHAAEAAILAAPTPEATQAMPFLLDRPILARGGRLDVATMAQARCPLTGFLDDGMSVDLGGRRLEVFHTPGHSPGSISLRDSATGTLFCGDVLLPGLIYDDIPGADRIALRASHARMARLEFSQSCGGHGPAMDRATALARMARYRTEALPD